MNPNQGTSHIKTFWPKRRDIFAKRKFRSVVDRILWSRQDLEAVLLLDHVGCLLGHSVKRACQVPAYLERQDGSIDDADIPGAVNSELGANNTSSAAWKHARSSNWVEV